MDNLNEHENELTGKKTQYKSKNSKYKNKEQQTENSDNIQKYHENKLNVSHKISKKDEMIIAEEIKKTINIDDYMKTEQLIQINPIENMQKNEKLENIIDQLIESDQSTQNPLINIFKKSEVIK